MGSAGFVQSSKRESASSMCFISKKHFAQRSSPNELKLACLIKHLKESIVVVKVRTKD